MISLVVIVLLINYALLCYGTYLTLQKITNAGPNLDKPFNLYPVSILKPLKGIDPDLTSNLESFFLLDYPDFELLFSLASAQDPARSIVERLMRKYPRVRAKLVIGEEVVGINPKVNNMVKTYELARNDLILISDSNIQVETNYLKRVVSHLHAGVGVVTGIIGGNQAIGLGGELESAFLNSFYARGINLAFEFGTPCVVGKSLLFRRKDLNRTGGMRALGNHINEDHQIGERIAKLGLSIQLMNLAAPQNIGALSFQTFWSRHLRWSRIRKVMAPVVYWIDPLLCCVPLAALGAAICVNITQALWFLVFHFSLWFLNDYLISQRMSAKGSGILPTVWFLREVLAFPLWLSAMASNSVQWRGHDIKLGSGGVIRAAVNPKTKSAFAATLNEHSKGYFSK